MATGRAALLIILLVLLAPGAAACSFAVGTPLPARLYVWDLDDARVLGHVDLWSRGLGDDCGLVKPHDLESDLLAWSDPTPDGRNAVYLARLDRLTAPRVVYEGPETIHEIDIHEDMLLVLLRAATGEHHVLRIDLETGTAHSLPVEPAQATASSARTLSDGQIIWATYDPEHAIHRLHVYDAVNDGWLHDGTPFSDLGLAYGTRWLSHAGGGWVIAAGYAHHLETGVTIVRDGAIEPAAPGFRHWTAIDGDTIYHAWYTEYMLRGVYAMNIAGDETIAQWTPPPHPLIRQGAVENGRLVLGRFSINDTEWGPGPRSPPYLLRTEDSSTQSSPTMAALIGVLALLVFAHYRARRRA